MIPAFQGREAIKNGGMMKSNIPAKRSEKGQSLVELGVSLVIILFLLAGGVDLGRMFFQYLAMRDAVQEGAAYISVYPAACNQAIERVRKNLANTDPSQINVTILVNGVQCVDAAPADACASKPIVITVHQPKFEMTMPLIGSLIGKQSVDLSASVTSAVIRPPCS